MSTLNKADARTLVTAGTMATLLFLAGCSRAPVPSIAPAATAAPRTTGTSTPTPASSPPVTEAETPTPFPQSPTAATLQLNKLSDVAFVDPLHGWALGAACDSQGNCPLGIRKSDDGGKAWVVGAAPQASLGDTGAGLPGASHLAFGSLLDGWAYGPSLFSTHDGGVSWVITAMPGDVIALQVGGGSAWALARACQPSGSCTLQLLSTPVGGGTWVPLPTQPPMAGDQAALVRGASGAAWLLSWSLMAPMSGQLATSHDDGATWQLLTDPTTARMCTVKFLAASPDNTHLWLLCGGEGATIMMDKALFRSTDGGANWSLVADATPPGGGGKNNLSLTGHVAGLAAPSAQRVFIGLARSTLVTSSDGGLTWNPSIPLDPQTAGDVGVERVAFIDADHGWALSGPTTLFRTEDAGAHWQAIPME